MKLIKKEDLIKNVFKRYKLSYYYNGIWGNCSFGMKNHRKHYELLKKATSEEDITRITGNSSWTRNECTECEGDFDILVQLGEEPSCDSMTTFICLSCLQKAIKLIKEDK